MKISASTNPPKLEDLNDYIKQLDMVDAVNQIHCDVMDGHFVKAKTFGAKKVAEIKRLTSKPLDVHLMVARPSLKLRRFVSAGADIVTVHFEAYKNKEKMVRDLKRIRALGAKCGLSLNPETNVLDVLPYVYLCDQILVMSVVPGKSGQEFLPQTYLKLDELNAFLKKQKMKIDVEIDGGVNDQNFATLKQKKVTKVVLGNYLFSAEDRLDALTKLKG